MNRTRSSVKEIAEKTKNTQREIYQIRDQNLRVFLFII